MRHLAISICIPFLILTVSCDSNPGGFGRALTSPGSDSAGNYGVGSAVVPKFSGWCERSEDYEADGHLDDIMVYTYDADGNPTKLTYYVGAGPEGYQPANKWFEWTYDDNHRMLSKCYYEYSNYYGNNACAYYAYDNDGNRTRERGNDYTVETTYDASGNKLSEEFTKSDGYHSTYSWTYNERGQLSAYSVSVESGESSITQGERNFYGENGELVMNQSYTIAPEYNSLTVHTYSYDSNLNMVLEETKHYNYSTDQYILDRRKSYRYDLSGNKIQETLWSFNSDTSEWVMINRSDYTYNEAGKVITYSQTQGNESQSSLVDAWEYDERGNIVRHQHYATWILDRYTDIYQYDEDGNVIHHAHDIGSDGTFTHTVWTYNAQGDWLKRISYGDGGTTAASLERNFDAGGNLLHEEVWTCNVDDGFSHIELSRISTYSYECWSD